MRYILLGYFSLCTLVQLVSASEVAITIDDPTTIQTPLYSSRERNQLILEALRSTNVKAALFVCGMRIDSPEGQQLLKSWDNDGHQISSHTYSHENYNSANQAFNRFAADILRVEPLISHFPNFRKFFRFPMLKEGNTALKRDGMRDFLRANGYRQGYVTIDASDWYIDSRLIARLKSNPKADISGYKKYFLDHVWKRTVYYDELARKVTGRKIKHTLLLHHNLLNALFLKDIIKMYRSKGWKIINPTDAYSDPVFNEEPNTLPAGEGIVWALAKKSGKFETQLRYPAEDGEYEKESMDSLGL